MHYTSYLYTYARIALLPSRRRRRRRSRNSERHRFPKRFQKCVVETPTLVAEAQWCQPEEWRGVRFPKFEKRVGARSFNRLDRRRRIDRPRRIVKKKGRLYNEYTFTSDRVHNIYACAAASARNDNPAPPIVIHVLFSLYLSIHIYIYIYDFLLSSCFVS